MQQLARIDVARLRDADLSFRHRATSHTTATERVQLGADRSHRRHSLHRCQHSVIFQSRQSQIAHVTSSSRFEQRLQCQAGTIPATIAAMSPQFAFVTVMATTTLAPHPRSISIARVTRAKFPFPRVAACTASLLPSRLIFTTSAAAAIRFAFAPSISEPLVSRCTLFPAASPFPRSRARWGAATAHPPIAHTPPNRDSAATSRAIISRSPQDKHVRPLAALRITIAARQIALVGQLQMYRAQLLRNVTLLAAHNLQQFLSFASDEIFTRMPRARASANSALACSHADSLPVLIPLPSSRHPHRDNRMAPF